MADFGFTLYQSDLYQPDRPFPLYSSIRNEVAEDYLDLTAIGELIKNPSVGPKLGASLITPFNASAKTKVAALESTFQMLVIDHDHDNLSAEALQALYDNYDCCYFAFSTSSHQQPPEPCNRWKVLIPYDNPISSTEHAVLAAGASVALNSDSAQSRISQGFFAPNKLHENAPYQWHIENTKPCLSPLVKEHPFVRDCLHAYEAKDKQLEEKAQRASSDAVQCRKYPPSMDGELFDKICNTYDIPSQLEQHGYKRCGEKFLSPTSESGCPGLVLLEGPDGHQRCYSHHGAADPLSHENHAGHALDVFDVICALDFGGDTQLAVAKLADAADPKGQQERRQAYRELATQRSDPAGAGVLVPVDLNAFWGAPETPQKYLVRHYFPKGEFALLAGHGGTGKTAFSLVLAAHVACGSTWNGLASIQSRVIFVSLEDRPERIRTQLQKICATYQLSATTVLTNLVLLDGTQSDGVLYAEKPDRNTGTTLLWQQFKQLLNQKYADVGLIFVDNASDAYQANENSRAQVREFTRGLADIAKELDAAVVLLAHIDKAAAKGAAFGNTYSGSTAWHNSARSRLALVKSKDNSIIVVHEKNNRGPIESRKKFVFDTHGVPLVAEFCIAEQLKDKELGPIDKNLIDLIPAFEAAHMADAIVFASLGGSGNSAQTVLKQFEEFPENLRMLPNRECREICAELIRKMQKQGVLKIVEYKDAYRNKRQAFRLAHHMPEPEIELPPESDTPAASEQESATTPGENLADAIPCELKDELASEGEVKEVKKRKAIKSRRSRSTKPKSKTLKTTASKSSVKKRKASADTEKN